jgi:hypothetical protein
MTFCDETQGYGDFDHGETTIRRHRLAEREFTPSALGMENWVTEQVE